MNRFVATLFIFVLAPSLLYSAEARYLQLSSPGSAGVVIGDHTAIIVDGGKAGALRQTPDGKKSLLRDLHDRGIKNIVVSCSHPHSDHAGGLRDLVRDKDSTFSSFEKIVFIDAGVKVGTRLFDDFIKANPKARNKAFHVSAKGSNAYSDKVLRELLDAERSLHAWNMVYTPKEKASVHGRTIISHFLIGDPDKGRPTLLIDFDDADDLLLASWWDDFPEDRWGGGNMVVVSPHHNSDHSNIGWILDRMDAPGGDAVIFAVNSNNMYRHPGPNNWARWLDHLGMNHVHVTAIGDVLIPEDGDVQPVDKSDRLKIVKHVLTPLSRNIKQCRRIREEVLSSKDRPIADDKSVSRYNHDLAICNKLIAAYKTGESMIRVGPTVQDIREFSPDRPVELPPADHDPKGGTGDYKQLKGGSTEGSRPERFRHATQGKPRFGGIVLGNELRLRNGDRLVWAKIEAQTFWEGWSNECLIIPSIRLLTSNESGFAYSTFDDMTRTELWCAYHIVEPKDGWSERFGVHEDEVDIVGMSATLDDRWKFGIHPAIANTVLARDAMLLDMAPAFACSSDARRGMPAVPELKSLMQTYEHVPPINYQWMDTRYFLTEQMPLGEALVNNGTGRNLDFRVWTITKRSVQQEADSVLKVERTFPPAERVGVLAKTIAILRMIRAKQGHLPPLPKELRRPYSRKTPAEMTYTEVKKYFDELQRPSEDIWAKELRVE